MINKINHRGCMPKVLEKLMIEAKEALSELKDLLIASLDIKKIPCRI